MGMKAVEILKECDKQGVRFLRLQFTDILGIIKNVEVPRSQFEKALDGEIQFDGSSIEGFTRIEESDMGLVPDLDTFRFFSRADISKMFWFTGSPASSLFLMPSRPAASMTVNARYGLHAGSGIRTSQRVPMPRRAGMRTMGERLRSDHATFTGAS